MFRSSNKFVLVLTQFTLLGTFAVGCTQPTLVSQELATKQYTNPSELDRFSKDGYANEKKKQLAELKGLILAYSKYATDRANLDESSVPGSRLYLASLIQRLRSIAPAKSFAEKQSLAVGAWQEIWSDARNPNPPGQKILRPNVFQVLFQNGVGFNFGVRSIGLPSGKIEVSTSVIELSFEKDPAKDQLNVTFQKTFTKNGDLVGESILDLAQDIKDGRRGDVVQDPERRFPRGPVGAKGELELIYVDEEIRISQGANPYSKVVDTFILVRLPGSSVQ